MNLSELLEEIEQAVRPQVRSWIASLLEQIGGAEDEFAALLTEDLLEWLVANIGAETELQQRNLRHLKAQVLTAADRCHIHLARDFQEQLQGTLLMLAQVLVTVVQIALTKP